MEKLIKEVLARIPSINVVVFGDIILDHFVFGEASRLSPEAPVPVVAVTEDVWRPGGAANTGVNVTALGATVNLVGVVGDDPYGETVRRIITEYGIDASGTITLPDRPTTYKARVLARHQQVVRIDRENPGDVPPETEEKVLRTAARFIEKADAVILSDYGKGLITPATAAGVIEMARDKGAIVTVDPKDRHFSLYRRATSITPNHDEAARAVGAHPAGPAYDLDETGRKILDLVECDSVLITCGEKGMVLYSADGSIERIPTRAREVFDVAGAGDTVIAAFTAALATGADPAAAAHLANFAASVVVGKLGTASATPAEIINAMERYSEVPGQL